MIQVPIAIGMMLNTRYFILNTKYFVLNTEKNENN